MLVGVLFVGAGEAGGAGGTDGDGFVGLKNGRNTGMAMNGKNIGKLKSFSCGVS